VTTGCIYLLISYLNTWQKPLHNCVMSSFNFTFYSIKSDAIIPLLPCQTIAYVLPTLPYVLRQGPVKYCNYVPITCSRVSIIISSKTKKFVPRCSKNPATE
jgi:hypothetical protein